MKYVLSTISMFIILLALYGKSVAQEKKVPASCQEQLNEVTVQAFNLDGDRDKKERELATAQVTIYSLHQQVAQLKKQIADVKKPLEEKKVE